MRTILLFFWAGTMAVLSSKGQVLLSCRAHRRVSTVPTLCLAITPTLTQGPKGFRGDNVSHQH